MPGGLKLSTGVRSAWRNGVRFGHCRGDPVALGCRESPRRIVMSQGGYVTLVGFVAQDPRQHETKGGRVTKLRIGATTRGQDRATQEWRDADTSYYDVSCWRRLGDHVQASMRKGGPVFVKGRFKARSYEDKTGQLRNVIDIQADAVGHDLNRGPANYMRPQPHPVKTEADPAGEW